VAAEFRLGRVVSLPFDENTYIAHFPDRKDCLVIDPGFEPGKIVDYLDRHELVPAAILCTHGHSDHIGGNATLKRRWPECPLLVGVGEAAKLTDPQLNLSAAFGVPMVSPPADQTLGEGEVFGAAGFELEVLAVPGHSAGHVAFVNKQSAPWRIFGGDVLFRGGVGRTDFFDGDAETLRRSIQKKLFVLPSDTIVLPGHGPATTIGHEKRTNPYVGAPAGYAAG
jgi:glyoxylase-like metal-dependent hydrolase (beta-lactamase superfamily II)